MASKKTRRGDVIAYTNDALGRLIDRKVPGAPAHTANGRDVDYVWDANNRVSQAKDGARVLASVTYDALSRRAGVTYANGASVAFGYTNRGDLIDHDLGFAPAMLRCENRKLRREFNGNKAISSPVSLRRVRGRKSFYKNENSSKWHLQRF